MNSYTNSYVNFAHEIRTKFVILDKLRKSSYEFARIREGYVMNGLYCIAQTEPGGTKTKQKIGKVNNCRRCEGRGRDLSKYYVTKFHCRAFKSKDRVFSGSSSGPRPLAKENRTPPPETKCQKHSVSR